MAGDYDDGNWVDRPNRGMGPAPLPPSAANGRKPPAHRASCGRPGRGVSYRDDRNWVGRSNGSTGGTGPVVAERRRRRPILRGLAGRPDDAPRAARGRSGREAGAEAGGRRLGAGVGRDRGRHDGGRWARPKMTGDYGDGNRVDRPNRGIVPAPLAAAMTNGGKSPRTAHPAGAQAERLATVMIEIGSVERTDRRVGPAPWSPKGGGAGASFAAWRAARTTHPVPPAGAPAERPAPRPAGAGRDRGRRGDGRWARPGMAGDYDDGNWVDRPNRGMGPAPLAPPMTNGRKPPAPRTLRAPRQRG